MKLALFAVLVLWTSVALAQNSKHHSTAKRQGQASQTHSPSPHHQAGSLPPGSGPAKPGGHNQQLNQLEHETDTAVTTPSKKAPNSKVETPKSSEASSRKRGINFSHQNGKSASSTARAQNRNTKGPRK
jgi:hypothetical protein